MRSLGEVVSMTTSDPTRYIGDERVWNPLDETMLNQGPISDQGSKMRESVQQSSGGPAVQGGYRSDSRATISSVACGDDGNGKFRIGTEATDKLVAGALNETQSSHDENDLPDTRIQTMGLHLSASFSSAQRVEMAIGKTQEQAHPGEAIASAGVPSSAREPDGEHGNQNGVKSIDEGDEESLGHPTLPSLSHRDEISTEPPQHTRSQSQDNAKGAKLKDHASVESSCDGGCSDPPVGLGETSTEALTSVHSNSGAHLDLRTSEAMTNHPTATAGLSVSDEGAALKHDEAIVTSKEDGPQPDAPPSSTGYTEVIIPWTTDQHRAFVSAVFEIGLKNCSPSVIMDAMKNIPSDISREKTKSHLQKFRKTFDRSLAEFMEEYDDFMKLIEEEKATKHDGVGHEPDDDRTNKSKAKLETEPKSVVNHDDPAALLEAVLGGKDPDTLLGGTAAAYAAYAVSNNCPAEDHRNEILYEASKEDFPVMSEEEASSVLGKSLMKVKGALEFVAEFVLKTRHGIPMKLDKKIPPFLEKEDVASFNPFLSPPGLERQGSSSVPFNRPSAAAAQAQTGMHPAVPYGYPPLMPPRGLHSGYSHQQGFVPGMPNQPVYASSGVAPGSAHMYYPAYGDSFSMGTVSVPPTRNGVPTYFGQPNPNQSCYPPHTFQHQGQMVSPPGPQAPYDHGPHLPMNHPDGQGHPYDGMQGHPPSQHYPPAYHSSRHPEASGLPHGGHAAHPQESYEHYPVHDSQPYVATTAAWPTTAVASSSIAEQQAGDIGRPHDRRDSGNDHEQETPRGDIDSPRPTCHESPPLRNVFDATPPSGSRSSTFQPSRSPVDVDEATTSDSPVVRENSIFTSPISLSSSAKRKNKRAWSLPPPSSPTNQEERHHSKRPQGGIFRVHSSPPTASPAGPERQLERPSSSLSFTLEELGLQSSAGAPRTEATSSPISQALRDVPWDFLSTDSIKDRHRRIISRRPPNRDSPEQGEKEDSHRRQQE